MRVIPGRFRGQRLSAPKGMSTRPTTDRVRESLFNILGNRLNFEGLRVLDLFAGTGALGIETLSRGAAFCKFVDISSSAISVIRENIKALALEESTHLVKGDIARLGECKQNPPFDLVFADPPYSRRLGQKAAANLLAGNWLSPDGTFVLEENANDFPESLHGFEAVDVRRFGQTTVGIFILEN